MNPTDPAFPVPKEFNCDWITTGMDLRTYMATAFLAADIAHCGTDPRDPSNELAESADMAVKQAEALIERLNQ